MYIKPIQDIGKFASLPKSKYLMTAITSILVGLLAGAVPILLCGENPLEVYNIMLSGAIGSKMELGETLIKSTVLIFTSLSYAFAYKCGLINVGAEGQLYIGAVFTTFAGTHFGYLPRFLHITLCILSGTLGGALWGEIVGFLKVKFNSNEVITTVMFNYIAINISNYMASGPMIEPPGTYPHSARIYESAKLTRLMDGSRLHMGICIAVLAVFAYHIYFKYFASGFAMRIVGKNPKAANYSGINVPKHLLLSMLVSGGLAGIAGSMEILGVQYRLLQDFSSGYGFDGIAAALLGNNSGFGIVFSSFLFGMFKSGGNMVQMLTKVPMSIISLIQGIIILFILINPFKTFLAGKAGDVNAD